MGMENQLPQKKLIDENGVLVKTPGMLRREREEQEEKETAEVAGEKTEGELLDRSKITEARKTRLETEIAQTGEKPKEDVLDRTLMRAQREAEDAARIQELKGTIEERLSAVEDKVGMEEQEPFSKEGLLNRNLGKK